MKFTLNWLKQYIDSGLTPAALADRLTMAGLEVDAVEPLCHDIDDIVVARVVSVAPHPNADKLTVCQVTAGDGDSRQVVCGAPNVRAGLVTAIALPGVTMPGGFKIKPAKLRGEKSDGMLCSAKELGIGDAHAGIIELPDDLPIGSPLVEVLALKDTMVEVDLTPNRADCASVLGIGREVGGFVGKRLTPPVAGPLPVLVGGDLPFAVEVQAAEDCPRYAARLICGVKIGPSPWWLKRLLLAVGLRPINNVVDVTNLVMLEYGQPLHAFDFAKLAGGRIVVRKARAGEKIVTLDDVERELDPETLVICDADKPAAVAGVMGGRDSQVDDATVDILLESAYFEPVGIRRAARRLNMNSDSSYRFERGVDPQGIPFALERAVRLILETAGGAVVEGGFDLCGALPQPRELTLRVQRANDLIGMTFTAEAICALLNGIEIPAVNRDGDTVVVTVPTFRVDLEREIDLIEEVARLHGYNEIPSTLPTVPMRFPEADTARGLRKRLITQLTGMGCFEAINYSFVTPRHFDLLGLAGDDPARKVVPLLNPLSEEQSVMRSHLLPGLLENLRRNINHQQSDVRLFEIGKVFHHQDLHTQPVEVTELAVVMSGRRHPGAPRLYHGDALVDIYDAKGLVDSVLADMRLAGAVCAELDPAAPPYAVAEAAVRLVADGKTVGRFGQLEPKMLKRFGIKQDAYFVALDLDAMAGMVAAPKVFAPLPKFPAVQWDIALIVDERVGGGEMLAAIADGFDPLIRHAEIFDIYRGKNIDAGRKSVAIAVTYRAEDRTLDDETVGAVHQRIIDMMQNRFGARLRDA
ncbi:MAG: phenylalanine--tRNA ligase subunit beta [Desulfobulbaceae bacterium]|nr:phenylalanine--tRNA ligase subunit beta [Desulfobulbaceae bacterium]